MPEGSCKTPQTTINFGERIFIEGRGFCLCHSGQFICDSSEEVVELDPGIYISLGFSRDELKMIKEKVPKTTLEKCGLVSPDISVQNDIASRLQFALERVLPKVKCCFWIKYYSFKLAFKLFRIFVIKFMEFFFKILSK